MAVVGVSADPVKSHQKFKRKHALPFPLVADTDHAVCEAYGVWQEKTMFGRKYMGIVRTTLCDGIATTEMSPPRLLPTYRYS